MLSGSGKSGIGGRVCRGERLGVIPGEGLVRSGVVVADPVSLSGLDQDQVLGGLVQPEPSVYELCGATVSKTVLSRYRQRAEARGATRVTQR